jgi:sulfoxide reductase heme-binding subunit YedZ
MPNQRASSQLTLLKIALFALVLLPLARLAIVTVNSDFGPDFVEFTQRWTGTWTLTLLLLTLCISPLRAYTEWHWLMRLRRMLGLFTFFYATLHFLTFIGLDNQFVLNDIARDIFKRPFVTLGFAAFLVLIPLAVTSNQFAVRRLGGRRWQELHRNIYLAGILGCLHYFWLSKPEAMLWPLAYSIALGLLLAWRIRERKRKAIPAPLDPKPNIKPLRFYKQKPPG